MAGLDPERWRMLDPLLDQALELAPEARARWLDDLRRDSPTLADELGRLLAADAAADRDGFLDEPIALPLAAPLVGPFEGLRLGSYLVERPLGRGGMGSVWLARRADGRFEGRVAIKFLNLALLGEVGRERFRREGSVLARLAHPGIARLLDAGVTEDGQPYLVLEHVDGECMDAFADRHRLGVAARVRLTLQVLAAVGHAHAQLVVHRDLKPSNILVTADGTAKLLDFGIATLLAGDDRDAAPLTSDGGRALTPDFAAPEQLRGEPVTTATDVYAVGVLLYLLLTGRPPYALAGRSAAEVERIVHRTEPPRPSATFADGPERAQAVERARRCGSTPDRMRRALRGDLDAIVMRALHKEPERRYRSAAALAEDLERYLAGRPVRARPDGTAYRLRRFVGRHRGAVAAALAVAVLGVGAGFRERELRARAEAEARQSRAVTEYLVGVFDVADPYASPAWPARPGGAPTARDLVDRGAARLDSALAAQPEVQAELRTAIGRVYANLGLFDRATPLLRRSLAQRVALHGADDPSVAASLDLLGTVLLQQDRHDEAEPLLRRALEQRRRLHGGRDTATAASLARLASLLEKRNRHDLAVPLYRESLGIYRSVLGDSAPRVASVMAALGFALYSAGAYDEAEPLQRRALDVVRRRLGDAHPATADAMRSLAQTLQLRGEPDEAERLYRRSLAINRRALGDAHPAVTLSINDLVQFLTTNTVRLDEAEALAREAIALDRSIFGDRHSSVAEGLRNLGNVRRLKGDFAGAERALREALEVDRATLGEPHRRVATILGQLALVVFQAGDSDEAVRLMRRAVAQHRALVGDSHVATLMAEESLGRMLAASGDAALAAEAERLLRGMLGRLDTATGAHHRGTSTARRALGEAILAQGRTGEALPILAGALAATRDQMGDEHWRTAEAQLTYGRALAAAGRHAEARPLLLRARATLERERRTQPRLAERAREAVRAPGER